jgi:hypothetical protein
VKAAPSIVLALVAIAMPALCADAPEPGVRFESADSVSRLEAVFDGTLASYALPAGPDNARALVALVAPHPAGSAPATEDEEGDEERPPTPPCPDEESESPPRTRTLELVRVEHGEMNALLTVLTGIPGDCTALDSVDLDGDGDDELLVGCPGRLFVIEDGGLVSIAENAAIEWSSLHPRWVSRPALAGIPVVTTLLPGLLQVWSPTDGAATWQIVNRIDLPLDGDARKTRLAVSSTVPEFFGRADDGSLMLATRPKVLGARRVRTNLIQFSPQVSRLTICWARLPSSEQIIESWFRMLDDRPVLIVTTKEAGKLGLFAEKLLRVFPLQPDRTRLGVAPLFATQSRINLWQEATPFLRDVNGDGRTDLVVGFWKGLKDDRVALDVYLRLDDGSFSKQPRSTAFDVKDGDRSLILFDRDLDGDGITDLLIRGADRLRLHRGLTTKNGKKLVDLAARELTWSETFEGDVAVSVQLSGDGSFHAWSTPTEVGRPYLADLDGDGRSEILSAQRGDDEADGVLRVIWIR